MTWSLITSADERDRCCVVIDGVRCNQPSARRVAGSAALDDYTYACLAHVALVAKDGATVETIGGYGAPRIIRP